MNVAILSGNLIVNSGCPPEYNFLKEAFVSGILDRFPDQEILFTEDTSVFINMPKQRGGFRCASTEIPLFIQASPEKSRWESILEKTFIAINELTDHTDLKTLFVAMHDLNITWATDLRKTVLSTYNERHPGSLLPVDWDAAVESLDTIYPIHKDGLLQTFTQLAKMLPPPSSSITALQDAL